MVRTYPINEIFYSLQGEGHWSGRPAVFVRFSGCNLSCPFCDTEHQSNKKLTALQIMSEIDRYKTDFIILTGGEPSLFMDEELIELLHQKGKFIAIETNGTRPLPSQIDWITLSPKDSFVSNASVVISQADELKLVFSPSNKTQIEKYEKFPTKHYFLQPLSTDDLEQNKQILAQCIAYCLEHPKWSLSLQTHKILGIR